MIKIVENLSKLKQKVKLNKIHCSNSMARKQIKLSAYKDYGFYWYVCLPNFLKLKIVYPKNTPSPFQRGKKDPDMFIEQLT